MRLISIALLSALPAVALAQPPRQHDAQIIQVQQRVTEAQDTRTASFDAHDLFMTQELLQMLNGDILAATFSKFRELRLTLIDGYWLEKIELPGTVPEGSTLKVRRESTWTSHVALNGTSVELERGRDYTFRFEHGRWSDGAQAATQTPPNAANAARFSRKDWAAGMVKNDWGAVTPSRKFNKQFLGVLFETNTSCAPKIAYQHDANGQTVTGGAFNGAMRFTTGESHWDLAPGTAQHHYDPSDDTALIDFSANMEFIRALAKGNKLSLRIDGLRADDFSLAGSWASIVWAQEQCLAQIGGNTPSAAPQAASPAPEQPSTSEGFCNACEPPKDADRATLSEVAESQGGSPDGATETFLFYNSFGEWEYYCQEEACWLVE